MREFRYALMDLTVADGQMICQDGHPFDQAAYSRFKYGWLPPAVEYGLGLADLVAEPLFTIAGDQPITIISAPYKYLPTASEGIAQALLQGLGRMALRERREFPVLTPFSKSQVGDSSYARSSEADRLKTLEGLGLRADESRITGCHVLAVDDIRITGTAEKVTARYLESLRPASIWYLHAARLPEGIGRVCPHLEDELNQAAEHSLEEILRQVSAGQFRLNTRVLRLLLETEEPEEFYSFLAAAPLTLVLEIYQAGVGNGRGYYEKYFVNLEAVRCFLEEHARIENLAAPLAV